MLVTYSSDIRALPKPCIKKGMSTVSILRILLLLISNYGKRKYQWHDISTMDFTFSMFVVFCWKKRKWYIKNIKFPNLKLFQTPVVWQDAIFPLCLSVTNTFRCVFMCGVFSSVMFMVFSMCGAFFFDFGYVFVCGVFFFCGFPLLRMTGKPSHELNMCVCNSVICTHLCSLLHFKNLPAIP